MLVYRDFTQKTYLYEYFRVLCFFWDLTLHIVVEASTPCPGENNNNIVTKKVSLLVRQIKT